MKYIFDVGNFPWAKNVKIVIGQHMVYELGFAFQLLSLYSAIALVRSRTNERQTFSVAFRHGSTQLCTAHGHYIHVKASTSGRRPTVNYDCVISIYTEMLKYFLVNLYSTLN